MRKSRFTEEKIIAVLAEQERGMGTAEICRKHGISQQTFYLYGRLSRCKAISNIYPASPESSGAPKWEIRSSTPL